MTKIDNKWMMEQMAPIYERDSKIATLRNQVKVAHELIKKVRAQVDGIGTDDIDPQADIHEILEELDQWLGQDPTKDWEV